MHQGEILPRGVDRIHLAPFEQGEIGSGSIPACLPSPSCSGIAFLCPPDMAADLICPEARREMVFLEQKAVACIFGSGKPDGSVRRYGWAGWEAAASSAAH